MSDLSLSGLSTGMDTQSIIEQLVQLEAEPIYEYQKEISELEETKGAWRDVNSRLDKLKNSTTDLKLSSTFNSHRANSSNEDTVTASASNDSLDANYNVTVKSTAQVQRIAGSQMSSSVNPLNELTGFDSLQPNNTININGTDITIYDTDTLNDVSNKINDADAGVRASIVDRHLVLETTETGVENALDSTKITDVNGLLEGLGVINTDGTIANELQAASDAEIDVNGLTGITSSTNTFSDVVEGVTFNVNPEAEVDSSATIAVSKNTQKAVDGVKAFVDQYNSTMNFLDGKTDYDQEEEKGAILQGDNTANRLQMRLREQVTSKIKDTGDYQTLNAVGVEIDRDGVMSFDSAKLEEALQNSPEEVTNLFTAISDTEGYDGMAVRMDSYLDQLMQTNTGLIPRRLDFYDNRIDNLNDDIEDVERKVEMTRERYVEQFSAMEEAISEMQSQQSWMMSQLQNMGGPTNMLSSMM
ncbi:MAG: flagellar filament capping protein FliD [Bacillota bacterium]